MNEKTAQPITNTDAPQPAQQPSQSVGTPQTQVVDSYSPSDTYYTNPLYFEVANYFNLQQEDFGTAKNKLQAIVEFAVKKAGTSEPGRVVLELRKIEDSIQKPGWDEKRYTNMYRYVRLASRAWDLEQHLKAYEK